MLGLLLALPILAQDAVNDAEELWRAGRRRESLERLEAELDAREDAAKRLLLVRREIEVHRYASALEHMGPLGDGARALRARALFRLGRLEDALPYLDEGDDEELLLAIRALGRLGRHDEADRRLDVAAERIGTADPRVAVLLGGRAARTGEHGEAVGYFRAASVADPWDMEALFGLGRALVRTGEREEGLALLRRHRELAPLFDELDFARRGVDLAPLHAANHARVGDVEREIGRTDHARAAYETALRLAGDDELVPIALRAARLHAEDERDVDAALRVLADASARVQDARLLVRAGDLETARGKQAEALEAYRAALDLRPGDAAIAERIRRIEEGERP